METICLHNKVFKKYLLENEIQNIIARLASEISRDLRDANPLAVPILNGSFIFAADLLRAIDFDMEVSFVKYSSYSGTQSSGVVKQLVGFPESVRNRNVLIIEDIVESGISMRYALEQLAALEPASVRICTFFHKPNLFHEEFKMDYIGKVIPDDFIVGYGLDYDGRGRCYRDVYVLSE